MRDDDFKVKGKEEGRVGFCSRIFFHGHLDPLIFPPSNLSGLQFNYLSIGDPQRFFRVLHLGLFFPIFLYSLFAPSCTYCDLQVMTIE